MKTNRAVNTTRPMPIGRHLARAHFCSSMRKPQRQLLLLLCWLQPAGSASHEESHPALPPCETFHLRLASTGRPSLSPPLLVNDVSGLAAAVADTSVSHIMVAAGTYTFGPVGVQWQSGLAVGAALHITRSVHIEAVQAGTVVIDALTDALPGTVEANSNSNDRGDWERQSRGGCCRRTVYIDAGLEGVVALVGLHITGGTVNDEDGAGVYVASGTAALGSCVISGNSGNDWDPDSTSPSCGGGVYVDSNAHLQLANSQVQNNLARSGANVCVHGSACTFGMSPTGVSGSISTCGGQVCTHTPAVPRPYSHSPTTHLPPKDASALSCHAPEPHPLALPIPPTI